MTEDITPTPPAWKDEKIQILDRLFERWSQLYLEIKKMGHLPLNTPEYDQELKKFNNSRDRIVQTIQRTLFAIDDEKTLNQWMQQYIELLEQKSNVPYIFFEFQIPREFVQKLDYQTAKKVYDYMIQNDFDHEQLMPGLTDIVK